MKKNNTGNKTANQKIKCDVNSCTYNNTESKECGLNEIKVSCDCNEVQNKSETICDSFKSNECDCNEKE